MKPRPPDPGFVAIDFGTSNSAIALPDGEGVRLVVLEGTQRTMPTAVFYAAEGHAPHEEPQRHYGRAAVAAYVDGTEGRLMRSMKSILGSSLATQSTEVGAGRQVRYLDVVGAYLRHLRGMAEAEAGQALTRVVLGRPVFFVDDDPARDAAAQAALADAAQSVGFREVRFQFEPIAAALDYERGIDREQLVLVADIGGGTSDFSLVRVGPQRRSRLDRQDDILGNHGVHIAGTDFDRHIELAHILPSCGYRGAGPHRARGAQPRLLRPGHLAPDQHRVCPRPGGRAGTHEELLCRARQHRRLMTLVAERLGHALIGQAEAAKIAVADGGHTTIDLGALEAGLQATLDDGQALAALDADIERIAAAADVTLAQAGVDRSRVDALYFTGGSTGLKPLAARIAARFPQARAMHGDRFASVAQGLGLHARAVFGTGV
jgi:hypothetical chaperone protein